MLPVALRGAGTGREALRGWALEPPAFPRTQNEAVLKLMLASRGFGIALEALR